MFFGKLCYAGEVIRNSIMPMIKERRFCVVGVTGNKELAESALIIQWEAGSKNPSLSRRLSGVQKTTARIPQQPNVLAEKSLLLRH